jgi:hypothetical protein
LFDFFILTVPVAAGTTGDTPKVSLRAQEANEKRMKMEDVKNKNEKTFFGVINIFIE